MYIDTSSIHGIVDSLCHSFEITPEELFLWLSSFYNQYFEDREFMFLDSFIKTHIKNYPDEILLFHYTRRLNSDHSINTGKNLITLLTTTNPFQEFLKEEGLTFQDENNQINVYYQNKLVDIKSDEYLSLRFGQGTKTLDYGFNGFMFKDAYDPNGYKTHLEQGPEFLILLTVFLNRKDILKKYYKNSTYYLYQYKIPIKSIIINKYPNLTTKKKAIYVIKKSMIYLIDHYYDIKEKLENPLVRYRDDKCISSKYFIQREEIENKE